MPFEHKVYFYYPIAEQNTMQFSGFKFSFLLLLPYLFKFFLPSFAYKQISLKNSKHIFCDVII